MEKQPKKQPDMLIEIGNKQLHCTPENTFGYLYEDPRFDHLFYVTEQNKDGSLNGYHLWRPMLDDMFDDAIYHMIETGYEVESLVEPDENDREAFFAKYKNEPQVPIKPLETKELTPRQEPLVSFMGYLIKEGHLDPADFNHEGEIYL